MGSRRLGVAHHSIVGSRVGSRSRSYPGQGVQSGSSLTIGEVAERTGLSVHALRFYEREGILPDPVQRQLNGHRVYSEDHVEWLAICKSLRASGMPLAAIRDYVGLIKYGAGNEAERVAMLRRHQASLLAKIDALRACSDWIEHKVGIYDESSAKDLPVDADALAAGSKAEQRARPAIASSDRRRSPLRPRNKPTLV